MIAVGMFYKDIPRGGEMYHLFGILVMEMREGDLY